MMFYIGISMASYPLPGYEYVRVGFNIYVYLCRNLYGLIAPTWFIV